jgi:hypothetical protein
VSYSERVKKVELVIGMFRPPPYLNQDAPSHDDSSSRITLQQANISERRTGIRNWVFILTMRMGDDRANLKLGVSRRYHHLPRTISLRCPATPSRAKSLSATTTEKITEDRRGFRRIGRGNGCTGSIQNQSHYGFGYCAGRRLTPPCCLCLCESASGRICIKPE